MHILEASRIGFAEWDDFDLACRTSQGNHPIGQLQNRRLFIVSDVKDLQRLDAPSILQYR